jgi:hypothetical protein
MNPYLATSESGSETLAKTDLLSKSLPIFYSSNGSINFCPPARHQFVGPDTKNQHYCKKDPGNIPIRDASY